MPDICAQKYFDIQVTFPIIMPNLNQNYKQYTS